MCPSIVGERGAIVRRSGAVDHLVVALVGFADVAFVGLEGFFKRVGGLAFAFEIICEIGLGHSSAEDSYDGKEREFAKDS